MKGEIKTGTDINALLKKQPILLFDGECGFCNRTVQFFLERERNHSMHFAALESEEGKALKHYFEIDSKVDSLILIRGNNAYIKSCAALRLAQYMKGGWPLASALVVIPPFLRNMVYDFIAKRRMKLFGRVDNCAMLQNEDRKRFLDMPSVS